MGYWLRVTTAVSIIERDSDREIARYGGMVTDLPVERAGAGERLVVRCPDCATEVPILGYVRHVCARRCPGAGAEGEGDGA